LCLLKLLTSTALLKSVKANDKKRFYSLPQSIFAEIKKSHFHLCHFFKPSNHSRAALLTFESSAAQIKLSQIAIISHQGFPTEKKEKNHKLTQCHLSEVKGWYRPLSGITEIAENKSRTSRRDRRECKGAAPLQQLHALQGSLLEQNNLHHSQTAVFSLIKELGKATPEQGAPNLLIFWP